MICEYCKQEHNGLYGSRRFCSQKCAKGYATYNKRNNINNQVRNTLKNKFTTCSYCNKLLGTCGIKQHEKFCKLNPEASNNLKLYSTKLLSKKELKNKQNIVLGRNKIILDYTYEQLNQYKKLHTSCEICGKTINEVIKNKNKYAPKRLSIDHDHTTNKFRGLLCPACNRSLGWYENHKKQVEAYLNKNN